MGKALKNTKSFDELYKELCDLPSNVVGEIINEELVVMPRPAPKHAMATSINLSSDPWGGLGFTWLAANASADRIVRSGQFGSGAGTCGAFTVHLGIPFWTTNHNTNFRCAYHPPL